jgi:cell division protein FtsB
MPKPSQIIIKPYSKRKKKKRLRRILLGMLTALVFVILTIYIFLSWLIKKEGKELEKLRSENQILKTEIKKFQSSDLAYEEFLRVKMGYIKNGEKVIQYK